MASTSARMLRLLSLLQTRRYWPGPELAAKLGVSERTLRRDIDRLRELGYPVDAERGVGGGYQLRSGTAMPPLLLDDEEAVAIAVGLRSAAAGAVGAGVGETSVRALAKVIQVMPPRLRRRVQALQDYTEPGTGGAGPAVDAEALTVLAQCCRDGERLRFAYRARDGRQSARTVEPHRLVALDRRWYLVAWDLERLDWRVFRVDRLGDPLPAGERFRPRPIPGGDAAAFVCRRLAAAPSRHRVVVDVQAPAARVQRALGVWGRVEATGEHSCRLEMNTDSLDWPVMILAMLGADFHVVRPPELLERLRATAAALTRSLERPAGGG
ncbi:MULTISPECIES: helix-turn-helix transcriptional regulator [Thermomonospora]|nr:MULTISPECIES: YafY family protein [Thermomonospora]